MIWLVIEDVNLFSSVEEINRLLALNNITHTVKEGELLKIPTLENINDAIRSNEGKVVVDYASPEERLGSNFPIFTTIYVKHETFPYKPLHKKLNISKATVLSERLALTISIPKVTLDDLAGAKSLHADIEKMLLLEEMRIRNITGLFLFGVAGAGKSFFAECFAGTTNRHFAELDLAHFMTLPNPTRAIDNLFHFLLSQEDKYLLLIDEIEKMFQFDSSSNHLVSDQIFGKMLTWLAKIYNMKSSNLIFVATANRVEKLLVNKPEFVRKGRFDRLYFLHYPLVEESAPAIFDLYFTKEKNNIEVSIKAEYIKYSEKTQVAKKLHDIFELVDNKQLDIDEVLSALTSLQSFNIERIVKIIDGVFQTQKITDSQYFIYTPPEIKSLVIDILDFYLDEAINKILKNPRNISLLCSSSLALTPIEEALNSKLLYSNPPMQITAKEGIRYQIAQGSNIEQGDKIAPFTEIS